MSEGPRGNPFVVNPSVSPSPSLPEGEILRVLFPSPIGEIGLTLQGGIVVHVQISPEGEARDPFAHFEDLPDSDFLDEMFGHLSEYFAGARPSPELEFAIEPLDLSPFAKRVLKETTRIPFGRTRTYRRIASAAGKPDAYRVVLSILAANPLPILVPCHRVVTHKSGIGSYIGGQARKKWLLAMEKEGLKAELS